MKKRYILAICLAAYLRTHAQEQPTPDSFGPKQRITGGFSFANANYVSTLDLDGDGDEDFLAGSSNRIAWFKNDGTGNTTQLQTVDTLDATIQSIRTGDLDNDGDVDILTYATVERVFTSYNGQVSWYENDGTGSFSEPQIITEQRAAGDIYPADLDGDADLDLVFSLGVEGTLWYENDGSGQFGEAQTVAGPLDIDPYLFSSVYAADLDGDGDQDVLTANSGFDTSDSEFSWYENDGTGQFEEAKLIKSGFNAYLDITTTDLDGDTTEDVLLSSGAGLYWFKNDGNGDFQTAGDIATLGRESTYAADLDGDGDTDLVTAQVLGYAELVWFENNGTGNFSEPQTISQRSGNAVYASDVDNDQDIDVIATDNNRIGWYPNNGAGNFDSEAVVVSPQRSLNGLVEARAADIDGDGDADVLSTSKDKQIVWFENNNAEFGPVQRIGTLTGTPTAAYPTDLDQDGDTDVVAATYNLQRGVAPSGKIIYYENNGAQTFEPQVIDSLNSGINSIFPADLNGDGNMDILAASDNIIWYRNNGESTFDKIIVGRLTTFDRGKQIDTLDIDNDGDLDVIVSPDLGNIEWFENESDGKFSSQRKLGVYATSSSFADLDGDGDVDLVAGTESYGIYYTIGSLYWYKNNGDGNFVRTREIELPNQRNYTVQEIATVDLDNDGDIDLLTGGLTFFKNEGGGRFGEARSIDPSVSSLVSVDTGDFDQDGLPDVLFGAADDIYWYENQTDAEPPPLTAQITGLSLYRSREDTAIATLTDGVVIDLDLLRRSGFNVDVEVQGDSIVRVDFDLQHQSGSLSVQRSEQQAPYVLFSHYGQDYFDLPALAGQYTLKIDVYEKNALGVVLGESRTINFTFAAASSEYADQ